jgi:hypothetical protein
VSRFSRSTKARQQLGAVSPPPKGWESYLIQNYYGGTPPSQLGVLTTALTASGKEDNSFFVTALSGPSQRIRDRVNFF